MIGTYARAWTVLTLGCALLGCGDDDDGRSITTGLPRNKPLAELNADELRTACRALSDGLDAVVTPARRQRLACTARAVPGSLMTVNGTAQIDVATCRMMVGQCVAAAPVDAGIDPMLDQDVSEAFDCASASSLEVEGCDVTVGEFESCLDEMVGAYDQFVSLFEC